MNIFIKKNKNNILAIHKEIIKDVISRQPLLDIAKIILLVIDKDEKILLINKHGYESLGFDSYENLIGLNWFDNFVEEKERIKVRKIFYNIIKNQSINNIFDYSILDKDKSIKLIRWQSSALKNENGEMFGVINSGADITHIKQAENELQKTKEKLEQYRKDIEEFVYIASHDLQEPLRVVSSYCQLLEKDYGNLLNNEGKLYVKYAVETAAKMKELIKNLLDFAKLGITDNSSEWTNIEEILKEFKEDVKISYKDIIIQSGEMPLIFAKKFIIKQLFQNLIFNAIKFRNNDRKLIIEISCENKEDEWEFSIKDNGIGIEPDKIDKIFQLFKRGHSQQYPGTGIGLATCKKIVNDHSGKIWVESKLNEGSTFYFTIAKSLGLKEVNSQ